MLKSKRLLCLSFIVLLFLLMAAFGARTALASQDSSGFPSITVESYTYNGATTYLGGQSTVNIPVGATVDFRVWVDIYNIDPVKIAYADGSSDTYSFDGSFSHDFYHTYTVAGGYVAEAYMPTDSGTFTGFADSALIVGSTSGNSGNQPSQSSTSSASQFFGSVYNVFRTIGQAFGLTGDTAAVAGVIVCCVILTPLAVAITRPYRVKRAKRMGRTPEASKKTPPGIVRQIPPTYSQPQNTQTNVVQAGYPIDGSQGQPITGAGITGTAIPPGLPSLNLRAKWAILNPGAASLDVVRQVNLNWDQLTYDPNLYKLEGYEIWKALDQAPTAQLTPDCTAWTQTFRGDVQGVSVRAVFSTPTGGYQYVVATSSAPL